MRDKDSHFWIKDVISRLPIELLPEVPTWGSLLTAITQLKAERNNALLQVADLKKDLDATRKQISDYRKARSM